jgi:hypothetical protein
MAATAPPSAAAAVAGPAAPDQHAWRRTLGTVLPLLVYLGLAFLLFHAAWAAPTTTTPGYRGDADGTIWYHAWNRYAVTHAVSPFTTDHINYPDGVNLAWQTTQPVTTLLTWPVAVTAGQYVGYDLAVTLVMALSAWFTYMVVLRWVPRRVAAFCGGLLYGFSPYMLAHALGHLNLLTAFVPPLMLAALDEIVVRQRRSWWRGGLVLGLLALVQFYCSEELLSTEGLMAVVGVAVLALLHRDRVRRKAPHLVRSLPVAAGVLLAGAAWPLWEQFTGPHRMPAHFQLPGGFSSDLASFVVPTAVQQVQPQLAATIASHFNGNLAEQNAYMGLPLVLILAYTIWRFRTVAWVRFAALLGVAAALLSMGPTLHINGHATHIPLPWVVIEHLPLFGNLLPSRVMVYAYLMAALLLALFVDHVARASTGARIGGAALLLAGALLLLPLFDYPASVHDDPRYFTAGGDARQLAEGAVVLVAPWVSTGYDNSAEMWQVESGMRFRMPEGYFNQPDPFVSTGHITGPINRPLSDALVSIWAGVAAPALTPASRAQFEADLRYWRVSTVIVGPMPNQDVAVRFLSELLGAPPREDQGVEVWSQPVVVRAASAPTSWSYTYTSNRS